MINPSTTFEDVDLVFCLKDAEKKVYYQNRKCSELCGNRVGVICDNVCMQVLREDEKNTGESKGFRYYKNRTLHGKKYDLVIYKDEEKIISMLHESSSAMDKLFEEAKLTRREIEVASMRFEQGLSHHEICKKLFISKATLKTHINNILKKIPQDVLTKNT